MVRLAFLPATSGFEIFNCIWGVMDLGLIGHCRGNSLAHGGLESTACWG
jgi:hypothetical protein